VRALAARIVVVLDPELDARHAAREDRRPTKVEVTLRSGECLVAERDVARGWPEDPLTPDEIVQKFRALLEPRYGPGLIGRLLETVLSLQDLADVALLGRLLEEATPA